MRCPVCGREAAPGDKAPEQNMAKHVARCRPKLGRARPLSVRLLRGLRLTEEGCLVWTGTRYRSGYGKIGIGGRGGGVMPAHRAAWQIAHGAIPKGMWVLHRCDNRPCANVAHLFLGTSDDNVADMVAKGRHRPQGRVPIHIGERQRRIARREGRPWSTA